MSTKRTGATRRADIPPDILVQLNAGTLETATLAEGLAIDFEQLLTTSFPDLSAELMTLARDAMSLGVTRRMEACGQVLLMHFGITGLDPVLYHTSDTVRGWGCYAIGLAPKLKFAERLRMMRPLADDPHFGVREWAWIPMRSHIAANVSQAVKLLTPWSEADEVNIRRYAVEVTRPRGVWTNHIEKLKQNPELALVLLENNNADEHKYIQDSVANWLNDASKTQPDWVQNLTETWLAGQPTKATERIVARARRSL
ncbi:MAG: DNA alkylation repair protein [Fimbriiglobus sp.]